MSYPGGKGGCYQKIINLMPPHEVYIEPYLGGGAVMLNKKSAQLNIGIDIDAAVTSDLSSLFMSIGATGNLKIVNGDAIDFFNHYKFSGKELIYCDPPYLMETRKGGKLYNFEYSVNDHIELLKTIKKLPCMVMISGYKSDLYMNSLDNWNHISFQSTTRQGLATEYIWMNYPKPTELHDYQYLGDTFRERERIKRKKQRWAQKFHKMNNLERQAVLAALSTLITRLPGDNGINDDTGRK